jgi:hypothetical protein
VSQELSKDQHLAVNREESETEDYEESCQEHEVGQEIFLGVSYPRHESSTLDSSLTRRSS